MSKPTTEKVQSCYQICNKRYTSMQPQRLFCKKGCDSEEDTIQACKLKTCNKVCIKSQSQQQKLAFKFLYRAPVNSGPCLSACIFGCNSKDVQNQQQLD